MDIIQISQERTKARRLISAFLEDKHYIEVETPIFSHTAIPENTIELYETERKTLNGKDKFYLLPSPELYMKRILAETNKSIYQFSKCFRNSEQTSKEHSPEFTMLEYYAVNKDEEYSLRITEELFKTLGKEYKLAEFEKPFKCYSMRELVKKHTSLDLNELQDTKALQKAIEDIGINIYDKTESWADSFNRLFVSQVEPSLADKEECLVIYDYPKQIECLCQNAEGGMYKKRWELYFNGIELANCYREETNKDVIKDYFISEDKLIKKRDKNFVSDFELASFEIPASSGVALGFDRLLMCLLKKTHICDIVAFYNML